MKTQKAVWLGIAIVVGMAVVVWISADYRDEVKQFLRALARAL